MQRDAALRLPRAEAPPQEPQPRLRAASSQEEEQRQAWELARRLRPKPPPWRAPAA
jgi:hypothetical protein